MSPTTYTVLRHGIEWSSSKQLPGSREQAQNTADQRKVEVTGSEHSACYHPACHQHRWAGPAGERAYTFRWHCIITKAASSGTVIWPMIAQRPHRNRFGHRCSDPQTHLLLQVLSSCRILSAPVVSDGGDGDYQVCFLRLMSCSVWLLQFLGQVLCWHTMPCIQLWPTGQHAVPPASNGKRYCGLC